MNGTRSFAAVTFRAWLIAAALCLSAGAHAQQLEALPPEVQFDILRLELDAAARDARHKDVLVIADKLRKMGIAMPAEVDFIEGKAFHALGAEAMARQSLVNYLQAVGRAGRDYDEAIRLFVDLKQAERQKSEHARRRAELAAELATARKARQDALAQDDAWKRFAVVFGGAGDDEATALAQGADGTLIVAGAVHARKSGDDTAINAVLPWISAFDAAGRRMWHRPLGSSTDAGSLRSAAENGARYVFAGAQKGHQFVAVSDSLGNLIKNAEGDPWVLGFAPAAAGDPGAMARPLPGGDVVAVGVVAIGGSAAGSPPQARVPVLVRLDLAGRIKGKAVLGDTGAPVWHRLHDAMVVDDGDGLVLVGDARAEEGGVPEAYVMRVDMTGQVVWNRRFAAAGAHAISLRAAAPAEGGLVVVGDDGTRKLVLRMTGRGDTVWRRTPEAEVARSGGGSLCAKDAAKLFAGAGQEGGEVPADFVDVRATACRAAPSRISADVVAQVEGGIVVIGHMFGAGNGEETVDGIVATAVRDDGQVIWQRLIGSNTGTRARAARATADGGVVVAGSTSGWERDVALFKLDRDGALVRFAALPPPARPSSPETGTEPTAKTPAVPAPAKEAPAPAPLPGAPAASPTEETRSAEEQPRSVPEGPASGGSAGPATPGSTSEGAEYDLIDLFDGLFRKPAETKDPPPGGRVTPR